MGYGYGIWFVLSNHKLEDTCYILHATIACNIHSRKEAERILEILGKHIDCTKEYTLHISNTQSKGHYIQTTYSDYDELHAWGYYCSMIDYEKIKTILEMINIPCSISNELHISMQYNTNKDMLKIEPTKSQNISANIKIVDIRSDYPIDWNIL